MIIFYDFILSIDCVVYVLKLNERLVIFFDFLFILFRYFFLKFVVILFLYFLNIYVVKYI